MILTTANLPSSYRFTEHAAYATYEYKTIDKINPRRQLSGRYYIRKDDLANADHPFAVSSRLYKQIVQLFFKLCADKIANAGKVVLPFIGEFKVIKADLSNTAMIKSKVTLNRGGKAVLLDWKAHYKKLTSHGFYKAVFARSLRDRVTKLYDEDDVFFNKIEESEIAKHKIYSLMKHQNK
jgi:hypothetical protein